MKGWAWLWLKLEKDTHESEKVIKEEKENEKEQLVVQWSDGSVTLERNSGTKGCVEVN